MNSRVQSETFSYLAETKLAGAIAWLPSSTVNQSISVVVDSNFMDDAELTACLSLDERNLADLMQDSLERRHYIFRRAFQRSFTKNVTGWSDTLSKLPIRHQPDTRPHCSFAPDLCLSFSSSSNLAIAGAARNAFIGVDVEQLRQVSSPLALSTRFFNPSETAYLAALPKAQQEIEFLKFWSIKEACLKAIGKGVVFGLETFDVSVKDNIYSVKPSSNFGRSENWTVNLIAAPKDCITVLARYAPC